MLRWLPVTKNKATGAEEAPAGDSPIKAVLRSKGFMWMSNSHGTAYFWSHAGMHFEIRDEGDWCHPKLPCPTVFVCCHQLVSLPVLNGVAVVEFSR